MSKKDETVVEGVSPVPESYVSAWRRDALTHCAMCPIYQVLTHINIGIIIGDLANNQILILNNEAARILSLKIPKEKLSHNLPFREILEALSIDVETINKVKRTSDIFSVNIKQRWIGYRIYRIMHTLIGIFLSDITEKKHLESLSEALFYAENLGYIFMCVRHEIGNPLNNIKTALNILRENIDEFSREKILEFIDTSLAEVGRIEKLLKMFKSYSLYDNIVLRRVSLRSFFKDFLRVITTSAEREGVKVQSNILEETKKEDISVLADPEALWHILLNLFTNALDAVKGTKNPLIRIDISRLNGERVIISVKDNGRGIPKEHLAHIFKPFFTTKPNGSGLGLPISQKLAAKMGGILEIKSEEGKGTVATLNLQLPTSSLKKEVAV